MKNKLAKITDKTFFCPSCHKEIKKPAMLVNPDMGKIKFAGNIIVPCWNCKSGRILIKGSTPPPKEKSANNTNKPF